MSLKKLRLLGKYAQRFNVNEKFFDFNSDVTLLIGPNGCGKSTILESINKELILGKKKDEYGIPLVDQKCYAEGITDGPIQSFYYDFEKNNSRVNMPNYIHSKMDITNMIIHKNSLEKSHGQSSKNLLKEIININKKKENILFLLDEPEQGLDVDGMLKFLRFLCSIKSPNQAIVATHHPILIATNLLGVMEMEDDYRNKFLDKFRKALCVKSKK